MEAEYEGETGRLLLDDGSVLDALGSFTVPGTDDFNYDVTIRYRYWEGEFDATEVTVSGREGWTVTGDVLRKVPVTRLLRTHLAGLAAGRSVAQGSDSELATVAAVYRLAYAFRERPVRAVADQLGIPASTAAKKVMKAREAGLLPPTTQGKAGV
jgi:hypothetical protein